MSDVRTKYGKYSTCIFFTAAELFAHLPLATIISNEAQKTRFFCVHGGISDHTDLDHVRRINRFNFQRLIQFHDPRSMHNGEHNKNARILSDLLWSDPIRVQFGRIKPKAAKKATGCYFNLQRNYGRIMRYKKSVWCLNSNLSRFLVWL